MLGFGMRVGDPALPLLKTDAQLDPETERLVRVPILRVLPDRTTDWDSLNGRLWIKRVILILGVVAILAGMKRRGRSRPLFPVKGHRIS